MPQIAVPPNRVVRAGRLGTSGAVVASWGGADGVTFRLMRTQTFTDRSGSVRVDARSHDDTWRPLWSFRYTGASLHSPRELAPDFYSAEAVLEAAVPRWAQSGGVR